MKGQRAGEYSTYSSKNYLLIRRYVIRIATNRKDIEVVSKICFTFSMTYLFQQQRIPNNKPMGI